MSLLSVLISPVNELVAAIPNLSSALECCSRIQNYVTNKKQVDFRNMTGERGVSNVDGSTPSIIEFDQVYAGWSVDKIVPRDLSVRIYPGTLNIILGGIGCGKSTFLQTLLGEGVLLDGSVTLPTDDIAYCAQTPFLVNSSIRQNILGNLEYDQEWYDSCLRACALDTDVRHFPDGDETPVGSKGIALSGGQKQRLVS
jgi:ABC-type bacteriocin/lantibiotic exporter with double-glycine peptidase domain